MEVFGRYFERKKKKLVTRKKGNKMGFFANLLQRKHMPWDILLLFRWRIKDRNYIYFKLLPMTSLLEVTRFFRVYRVISNILLPLNIDAF